MHRMKKYFVRSSQYEPEAVKKKYQERLKDELNRYTGSTPFVSFKTVKDISTESGVIRCILQHVYPGSNEEKDCITSAILGLEKDFSDGLLRVFAILLYMDWDGWSRFKDIFLDHKNRKDANMLEEPFKLLDLQRDDFFGDTGRSAREFENTQYWFLPIHIKPGCVKYYEGRHPMPFVSQSKLLNEGGYGKVYEDQVMSGHLHLIKNGIPTATEKIQTVARKELRFLPHGNVEFENLSRLEQSLANHQRLVPILGAVVHNECYHLFFPKYNLDLEQYLENHNNHLKDKDTFSLDHIYNTLVEIGNVAHALEHLHGGHLRDETGQSYAACHLDIKPNNILINWKPDHPDVANWSLADFGISRIKKARSLALDQNLSVSHPNNGQFSNTAPRRVGTFYDAPEVTGPRLGKRIGPASDVWSYGVVIARVFTFLLDGPDGSTKFYDDIMNSDPDGNGKCFEIKDDKVQRNPVLERILVQLCNHPRHKDHIHWSRPLLNIILSLLEVEPSKRLAAKGLVTEITTLCNTMRENLQIASSSTQTIEDMTRVFNRPSPTSSILPSKQPAFTPSSAQRTETIPSIGVTIAEPSRPIEGQRSYRRLGSPYGSTSRLRDRVLNSSSSPKTQGEPENVLEDFTSNKNTAGDVLDAQNQLDSTTTSDDPSRRNPDSAASSSRTLINMSSCETKESITNDLSPFKRERFFDVRLSPSGWVVAYLSAQHIVASLVLGECFEKTDVRAADSTKQGPKTRAFAVPYAKSQWISCAITNDTLYGLVMIKCVEGRQSIVEVLSVPALEEHLTQSKIVQYGNGEKFTAGNLPISVQPCRDSCLVIFNNKLEIRNSSMVLEQKLTPGGGSTIPEHFIIGTIKVCIESNRVFALSQAEMGVYCNIWDISDGNLAAVHSQGTIFSSLLPFLGKLAFLYTTKDHVTGLFYQSSRGNPVWSKSPLFQSNHEFKSAISPDGRAVFFLHRCKRTVVVSGTILDVNNNVFQPRGDVTQICTFGSEKFDVNDAFIVQCCSKRYYLLWAKSNGKIIRVELNKA